ncbi:MAG TPA: hypothetical protein VLE47_00190, partial [Candidatus Saccharimonadales bacterium]|nr:hypothetical protein [Candidatus Saccharimonadales bacterium]
MKVSKKAKKLAKEIIFASKEKGTTSEEKLKKFTKILVDSKEPIASEILSEIVKTYEKELESSVL